MGKRKHYQEILYSEIPVVEEPQLDIEFKDLQYKRKFLRAVDMTGYFTQIDHPFLLQIDHPKQTTI